jgi:hypothetical protein
MDIGRLTVSFDVAILAEEDQNSLVTLAAAMVIGAFAQGDTRMPVFLLVVGILVSGAGLAAIGFGVLIHELGLGHTLIVAGTAGFAGGIVLIGLAAALRTLAQIAEALSVQSVADPHEQRQRSEGAASEPRAMEARRFDPRPVEPRPIAAKPASPRPAEPQPVRTKPEVDATPDVSASAIERLRSSIGRPPKAEVEADDAPLTPDTPPPRSAQNGAGHEASAMTDPTAVETPKAKRLDFLFRSRSTPSDAGEPFVPQWPQRSARELLNGSQSEPALRPAKIERPATEEAPQTQGGGTRVSSGPAAQEPQEPQEPRSSAILKSGVVDGMAYTLYTDGSIEAQLPQGTVRFESIAELRSHIENKS